MSWNNEHNNNNADYHHDLMTNFREQYGEDDGLPVLSFEKLSKKEQRRRLALMSSSSSHDDAGSPDYDVVGSPNHYDVAGSPNNTSSLKKRKNDNDNDDDIHRRLQEYHAEYEQIQVRDREEWNAARVISESKLEISFLIRRLNDIERHMQYLVDGFPPKERESKYYRAEMVYFNEERAQSLRRKRNLIRFLQRQHGVMQCTYVEPRYQVSSNTDDDDNDD